MISEDSGLQMIWCFPPFSHARAVRGYIIPQPTVFFRRCVTDRNRLDPTLRVAIDHAYWLQIGGTHRFFKIGRIQAGDRDHGARISKSTRRSLPENRALAERRVCSWRSARLSGPFLSVVWKALMRIRDCFMQSASRGVGPTDAARLRVPALDRQLSQAPSATIYDAYQSSGRYRSCKTRAALALLCPGIRIPLPYRMNFRGIPRTCGSHSRGWSGTTVFAPRNSAIPS